MQTLMFDPGGFKGRLRAYPFLGTWRALLYGEVLVLERLVVIRSVLWQMMDDSESSCYRRGTGKSFTLYVLRSIAVSPQPGWFENVMPSKTARGHLSCGGERMSGNAMSEELDGKELHGALGGECYLEPRGSAVS